VSRLPTRVAVVAVALCAIAWLGVSWSNARVAGGVQAVIEQRNPPRPQVDQALRDVDRTQRLNPDRAEALSLRAVLYVRAGQLDRAAAEVEKLIRIEPESADAWQLLAAFTQQSDPKRSAEARERGRELNPRGAR
jgi:predicted Zn-dependent protease